MFLIYSLYIQYIFLKYFPSIFPCVFLNLWSQQQTSPLFSGGFRPHLAVDPCPLCLLVVPSSIGIHAACSMYCILLPCTASAFTFFYLFLYFYVKYLFLCKTMCRKGWGGAGLWRIMGRGGHPISSLFFVLVSLVVSSSIGIHAACSMYSNLLPRTASAFTLYWNNNINNTFEFPGKT